jgi:2-polyprenyl-6-methoxyphenol hydroxylase-like FAD-dependent oxidoreductase
VVGAQGKAVTGVRITDRTAGCDRTLAADLVVDATGRGSATPRWLKELGHQAPDEDEVNVDVGYATRLHARDPNAANASTWYFVSPTPPHDRRGGVAFPIEGDRWLVMLSGMAGDHPPADADGFADFARSLASPDINNAIDHNAPMSDIVLHKFPSSRRRRYDRLDTNPAGLVVVGDAFASFNPIYGQGMTSAALQVDALSALLADGHTPATLPKPYYLAATKVIDRMWRLAVGEDFRYQETTGHKALGTDLVNAYVTRIHHATHHDEVVGLAFLRVMHMLDPPSTLFHPRIARRVLARSVRGWLA